MIISWNPHALGDALVLYRRPQHHAVGELVDHAALDLLPRGLARRIFVTAALLQRRAAFGELRLGNENVGGTLAQIDAHRVAVLEQGESAAGRRLGRGVEDRGGARSARLAPVAD